MGSLDKVLINEYFAIQNDRLAWRQAEATDMKAGRLFEEALKQADIDLTPGTEFKVQVMGQGKHVELLLVPPPLDEFEASILERASKVSESMVAYQPKLSIGESIRALRKASGMTLDALAAKAEISKGSLCSIENGKRPAGLAVLRKLAKAMGVPLSVLAK